MCWAIWNWPIQLAEAKCRDVVVSHYPVKLDEEEFERIKQSRAIRYLLTPSVFAKTLYVGTCHTPSYSTISAAVAAAPAAVRKCSFPASECAPELRYCV